LLGVLRGGLVSGDGVLWLEKCSRCGRYLEHDRAAGLWRARGAEGLLRTYCSEAHHFPAWKHTPAELTPRQRRAVEKAGGL
jgi:hypothetical protein